MKKILSDKYNELSEINESDLLEALSNNNDYNEADEYLCLLKEKYGLHVELSGGSV